jgi:predicted ATP-grasp superfamily ATP-dependent carboligase
MRTPRPRLEPRLEPAAPEHDGDFSLDALVREWLLELKVMGRSPRTIEWYAQKMRSYLTASDATRLSERPT